jgi:hypothetical protein
MRRTSITSRPSVSSRANRPLSAAWSAIPYTTVFTWSGPIVMAPMSRKSVSGTSPRTRISYMG